MNTWYKFIVNALFSKREEDSDAEIADKDDDLLANYIELDSLMQVIYYANKETDAGN